MISKSYIQENLRHLEVAFNKATMQKHLIYFSKLAILELCGWIEVSMDDLMLRHSTRTLKVAGNVDVVEKFVKYNYGFDYDNNFRQMLMRIVGLVTCEQIEASINPQVHANFTSQLGNLKVRRNSLAHTYIKGRAIQVDSPMITKGRFLDVYEGLKAYEKELKKL